MVKFSRAKIGWFLVSRFIMCDTVTRHCSGKLYGRGLLGGRKAVAVARIVAPQPALLAKQQSCCNGAERRDPALVA
jgi:hypothetical protein